ncbi:hypothetical protein BDN67DRAFT_966359 [Paxillus ammoniavirescens]|nr:hypothetical protein BDN67DRAFT_966359 [Paxillus ammoniavirescens]
MDAVSTEKYLRVASIAIASYDYIITLPTEWRFYRSQYRMLRISLACILFVLIRYVSIMVMVVSNYGVFATSFTQELCQRYYLVSPTFKVLQTMISHAILGVRTFNITRRNRQMGTILLVSFVVATGLEWFTNFYDRVPVVLDGNCTPGNPGETAWIYYVVVMVYDLGTLVVSTVYLVRHNNIDGRFSRLIKTMLYDGLGYFAALTAVNIFNVVLYRTSDQGFQSSGASCGYAVTWIMSQRILIHLRELTSESQGHFDNVVVTRQLQPGRDVATAIRSQFESQKGPVDLDLGPDSPAAKSTEEMELDIRVHVERSVTIDCSGDRERFGKPRGQWEKKPHSGV